MRVAAQVRLRKESHPEEFCPDAKCLWRIWTRAGAKPCPTHMLTSVRAASGDESAPTQLKEPT